MILTILLVIIGVLLVVLAVYLVPKWQTKRIIDFKSKRWQAENEFRKTLIQVFGGLVVIAGLFFAYQEIKNFQLAQKNMMAGQIATRFSKAIELLSEGSGTTKIGGIYALEQIAKETPENYLGTVIEVLSAFVRNAEVDEIKEDAKKPGEKKEEVIKDSYKIKPETQIALTVLGRVRTEDNKKHWEKLPGINLDNAKLMGADLWEANLTRANLTGADLWGADLGEANLAKADLTGANLAKADLTKADLTGADLRRANLTGAVLWGAKLMEAYLMGAYLTRANLSGADLRGAKLMDAYLTGAYLMEADLTGANFWGANLTEANLTEANLTEAALWLANLGEADLTRANLTGADLRGAQNLKIEQLLEAKTLFKVMYLPPAMKKELKKKKPELFE